MELDIQKPLSRAEERAAADKPPAKGKRQPQIPTLPPITIDPNDLRDSGLRAEACVNMKLSGASFHEIAKELDYANAHSAQTAYYAALAHMHPQSNWETLRQEAALRAEAQFRRSFAMASAEYLLVKDAEGSDTKIPNVDRLRWHEQAGKDLTLLVMITGAKAPARLELTATTAELNQMVTTLLLAQGGTPEIEADVFDMELLPPELESGESQDV